MNSEWRCRYETALAAARQAGQHALRYFDRDLAVDWKQDASPVTVADRETEALLRTVLSDAFANDGFLGEEHGEQSGSSGFRWVLDPIDGTRSFVRGVPIWGTLVGLEYRGEPIAGVAYAPALNQLYHALRGEGAYRDDRRIHVSEVADLAKAHVYYSSVSWFTGRYRECFLDLVARTERQRGFGDFYGHVLVAQGSGELMIEHGLHIWDVIALVPIVEEAGGRITNWDGGRDFTKPDVAVSNGKLHDVALRILGQQQ